MNEALAKYLAGTSHDIASNEDLILELEAEVAGESGDDNAAHKAAG